MRTFTNENQLRLGSLGTYLLKSLHENIGTLPLTGRASINKVGASNAMSRTNMARNRGKTVSVNTVINHLNTPGPQLTGSDSDAVVNRNHSLSPPHCERLHKLHSLSHRRADPGRNRGVTPHIRGIPHVRDTSQRSYRTHHHAGSRRGFYQQHRRLFSRQQTPKQGQVKRHIGHIAAQVAGLIAQHWPTANAYALGIFRFRAISWGLAGKYPHRNV